MMKMTKCQHGPDPGCENINLNVPYRNWILSGTISADNYNIVQGTMIQVIGIRSATSSGSTFPYGELHLREWKLNRTPINLWGIAYPVTFQGNREIYKIIRLSLSRDAILFAVLTLPIIKPIGNIEPGTPTKVLACMAKPEETL